MIKIAFFGTPELTVTLLDALRDGGLAPALIVTPPDRPKGRKLVLTPPAAKVWAIENNISYLQPETLDDDFIQQIKKEKYDLFVVAAYGKIFPEALITTPTYGTLNIHYSLLPKYRGATPVESAILNGDTETGVCIQKMEYKLDTGAIVALDTTAIPADITAQDLRDVLNKRAAAILPSVIKKYVTGEIVPKAQDDVRATYCKKISKEDGLIDIHADAILNDRKYRAYFGWPGTYYFTASGTRVIISKAGLENGVFKIEKVIPEGKKEMSFSDFSSRRDL